MNTRSCAKHAATLAFIALFVATFFVFVYKTTFEALSPSFAIVIGASTTQAGMQSTVFFVAAIAARFLCGPLAGRCNERGLAAMGAFLLLVGGILATRCSEMAPFLAVRVIQAFGIALFYPAATATASMLAPKSKTGLYLGAFRVATVLPMAIGPASMLDFATRNGFNACFAALAAGPCIALALTLVFLPKRAACGTKSKQASVKAGCSLSDLFRYDGRQYATALGLSFCASLGFTLVSSFAVLYAQGIGAEVDFGAFFALFGLSGLVISPLAGTLSDKIGARGVLCCSFSVMCIGLLCAAAPASGALPLYATALLVGVGKSGATVGILAITAASSEQRTRTFAISMQQNCSDLGSACATLVFGAAFNAFGFSKAVMALAALPMALSAVAAIIALKRAAK